MFSAAFGRRGRSRRRFARAALAALALVLTGPALAVAAQAPIPILVYHRFDPTTAASTTVRVSSFEDQLAWLDAHGYRIAPLGLVVKQLTGAAPPASSPEAAVTADDGNESVYTQLFPLILKHRIPVTLFIYPSAISHASYALTWAQLREMQASGLVDIQSHTYWHPNFKIERRRRTAADYQAFVDMQLQKSKTTLEARVGQPVAMLAWPYGIVDPDLEAAARRAGYVAAFAFAGGPARPGDDVLAFPRIPVEDSDRGARFAAKLQPVPRRAARP